MRFLLRALSLGSILTTSIWAGSITTYTDRTSFNAAAGTVNVETFGGDTINPVSGGSISSGDTLNGYTFVPGVTYSTPVPEHVIMTVDYCPSCGFDGVFLDNVGFNGVAAGPLTATFDAPVGAVAFDTDNLGGGEEFVTIQFASDPQYSTTFAVTSLDPTQFFGFQSSAQDITSIVVGYTNVSGGVNYGFAVDNFTFSDSATAPEPASLVLFGSALVTFGIRRIRSRA